MINQRSISYSRSVSISAGKLELNEEERAQVLSIKRKFWWFSTVASINHALNYVVTSFATSLLSKSVTLYDCFLKIAFKVLFLVV